MRGGGLRWRQQLPSLEAPAGLCTIFLTCVSYRLFRRRRPVTAKAADLKIVRSEAAAKPSAGHGLRPMGYLTLHRKFHGQYEDFIPFLNGDIVAPGLHFRDFEDDLAGALFD